MHLKLTGRFLATLLVVGIVPLAVLSSIVIQSSRVQMVGQSKRLHQAAINTLDVVERNLFERYGDVQAFTTNRILQFWPLDDPDLHKPLTETINQYVEIYGCYVLSMITDAEGKCVAVNTVDAKGKPVRTDILLGRDYSRASWFRAVKEGRFLRSATLDGTVVEDVARDPDVAAVFGPDTFTITYAAPIKNAEGKFIGVWRNLADFSLVEDILRDGYEHLKTQGLPRTRFILLDRSGRLLADLDPVRTGTMEIDRSAARGATLNLVEQGMASARAAVGGGSGAILERDAAGGEDMGTGYHRSEGALGYPGLGWSLLVRTPERDLNADAHANIRNTWITLVVSAVVLIGVAVVVARSLTRPILACANAMQRVAEGDLTVRVGLKRADEIGRLGEAIDGSIGTLRELVGRLSSTSTNLSEAAQNLKVAAHSQAAAAEETTAQAHTVATASEELSATTKSMASSSQAISSNVTTIAASMEEMSASIQEVAKNCSQESEIAQRADTRARETKEMMGRLDASARQIGRVVELINRIAEQTNLLALNAAIEAASAGEAGRGFAVVANEVKELARQSAAATEDIRRQIESMQADAGTSMKAIDEVAEIIAKVSEIASSIAAAVEEQSATTSEVVSTMQKVSASTEALSRDVAAAAEGAQEVARNIDSVSNAASDVSRTAIQTSTASTELENLAIQLGEQVRKFKTS